MDPDPGGLKTCGSGGSGSGSGSPTLVWIMGTLTVAKNFWRNFIRRDPDPHWEYGSGAGRAKLTHNNEERKFKF
jgi:hypothetical protein